MAEDVSTRLRRRQQGRRFGVTVGLAFLAFAGLALWRDHPFLGRVLGSLGATLVVLALLVPLVLLPVERVWMRMAHLISRITTPIVLGVFYFLILTPVGLARRAFGRHGLPRSRPGISMWQARPEGNRRGDLRRQF